jgi:hypothetical protein
MEVIGISGFGAVCIGRFGRRARMRMVEANDVQPAPPRAAPAVDVILRIDQKARRFGGDVPRPHGVDDLIAAPNQQPAALRGRRLARVVDDRAQSAL